MRAAIALALVLLSSGAAQAVEPKTEDEKTLYAIGLVMSQNLTVLGLSDAELAHVVQGVQDGATKKAARVKLEEYGPKIQGMVQARAAKLGELARAAGKTYQDAEAKKKGVKKTSTGLLYQETKAGSGPSPAPTDTVKVHYKGTLIDGKVFDSSIERGEPIDFALNQVIPCWTEGVGMMKKGGKARLICPPDLAYGEKGAPPDILPGSTLVFEVELLDIVKK
jgi:FKBP-type peptidyl-prolyl cis-trans isomerase FkpA